jgi:hypothetical protein
MSDEITTDQNAETTPPAESSQESVQESTPTQETQPEEVVPAQEQVAETPVEEIPPAEPVPVEEATPEIVPPSEEVLAPAATKEPQGESVPANVIPITPAPEGEATAPVQEGSKDSAPPVEPSIAAEDAEGAEDDEVLSQEAQVTSILLQGVFGCLGGFAGTKMNMARSNAYTRLSEAAFWLQRDLEIQQATPEPSRIITPGR